MLYTHIFHIFLDSTIFVKSTGSGGGIGYVTSL